MIETSVRAGCSFALDQAVSLALLAAVEKASGQREEAAETYRKAIDAVEAQRSKVGGTDLEHAAFSGRSIGHYRDAIALLHELGRDEEGFALSWNPPEPASCSRSWRAVNCTSTRAERRSTSQSEGGSIPTTTGCSSRWDGSTRSPGKRMPIVW